MNMVNISQRTQFVGKENKVLLSEFVDINHMFIFYVFINEHQYISIQICCILFCIILKSCFAIKDSNRPRYFIMLACQVFGYFVYFTSLTYDNF